MIIRDEEYGEFEISLGDDGTLDTVIVVDPIKMKICPGLINDIGRQEIRFSTEYAAYFRNQDGEITQFEELGAEAFGAYIEQYLI